MTIVHQYAIVDNDTNEVIGKYVRPFQPPKMQNIPYVMTTTNPEDDSEISITGTAFLSKAVKYWEVVKNPLYLVTAQQININIKLEGFI